ncbi:uncharacterized protein LOC143369398 isoform X2 [Andrena cerasifolii]|uniref:uncharacterized protein LOC143369398 isoform X2 n=1 Tax=Andrena cerasifolii TaxID=2819439 RepID=UPI0040383896
MLGSGNGMPNIPASAIGKDSSTIWNFTSVLSIERVTSPRVCKLPDSIPMTGSFHLDFVTSSLGLALAIRGSLRVAPFRGVDLEFKLFERGYSLRGCKVDQMGSDS